MKSNKQLDEMQESKLLKIQEKGFWLVFWILFAAIFVQALIGMTLKEIAGEIVVLVAASIYIAAASLKNGLWTRNIQPTIKSNLATSIIPALILGVFWTIRSIVILDKSISESSVQIVIAVLSAYVVCFLMLEILRRVYKHQREKLDDVEEEGKE